MADATVFEGLLNSARQLAGETTELRRTIHAHPELGYEEYRTSALVAGRLRALGLEPETEIAGTGVVARLEGTAPVDGPRRTVLLRADMDALPILEETGLSFASEVPGRMHACGHDAHTASLLGAAKLLVERRNALAGDVVLLFQPAEEGGGGAKRVIDEGVLERHHVDVAHMIHVWHELPAGAVGIRAGGVMAGALAFTVRVEGKGGHAARPHQAIDPGVAAAFIVTALQTVISREIDPQSPAVLTVGRIEAGTAHNVIADTAIIEGTARAYDPSTMARLRERTEEVAKGVGAALRTTVTVTFGSVYPPVVCDPRATERAEVALRAALGAGAVRQAPVSMGSEDFGYVLEKVPGSVLRLGVRAPGWASPRPMHTATFDLDEKALPLGVAGMAAMALGEIGAARLLSNGE